MSSDQLDFVTYCIGNLSIRLQLPQKAIYARLKSTGILDDYIVKGYDVLHTFGKEYLMEDLIGRGRERGRKREREREYVTIFYLSGKQMWLLGFITMKKS